MMVDGRNEIEKGLMWLIIFALFVVLIFAFDVEASEHDRAQEVSDVMYQLLEEAPGRKLYTDHAKRLSFARDIVMASDIGNVPEFLLTSLVYRESSFRTNAIAQDKPTVGLGQIFRNGVASKDCDLKTRLGQLICSAKFLRICYDKCGSWESGLTAYATPGYCSSSDGHTKWSARSRIKMWQKFEKQRERIREEIQDDLEHYADLKDGWQ